MVTGKCNINAVITSDQWKLNTTSDLQEMIEIPEWRSHEGFQSFLEGHEWCSIHWSRVMTELITLFSIQGISTRRFTGGKYRHHCCFPSFLALFWFFIWHIAISRVFFAEITSLKSTFRGSMKLTHGKYKLWIVGQWILSLILTHG